MPLAVLQEGQCLAVVPGNGGSALTSDRMAEALGALGFEDLRHIPTVPGGPVLVAGRRPDRATSAWVPLGRAAKRYRRPAAVRVKRVRSSTSPTPTTTPSDRN
ncbi:hypothetical protein [Streptomyces sp. NBC_01497]|uniref:hypothetical protein n=1 Tax=Streptomyces sp. NBC_01497 TaxID=2903885 RepID=UPI002E2F1115|nr:hypothetical protein [Streptomyces sp. NBC_01497]